MTISFGAPISYTDYNNIYNAILPLLGSTSTGYGYPMASYPQTQGQVISAQAWRGLFSDVQAAYVHQNGVINTLLPLISTATNIIRVQDVSHLFNAVAPLVANTWTVAANQLTTSTFNTLYSSSPVWSRDFHYSVTYNWDTPARAQYFFNLGGRIQPQFTATGVDLPGWTDLLGTLNSLYCDHTNWITGIPFNGNYNVGSNYVNVSATFTNAQFLVSIDFTNTNTANNLQIYGALATTYSNGDTGGISSPPFVPAVTSGGGLSPLPIPPFSLSVGDIASQTMSISNNTGYPVDVNMSLTGYGHGSLYPASFNPLANNTTATFTINYTGPTAGTYRGNLVLNTGIGSGFFPTVILVGTSVTATADGLTQTVNSIAPVYSGAVSVSTVGVDADVYSVTLDGSPGFSLTELDQTTPFSGGALGPPSDKFLIKFDPSQNTNGTHSGVVTVSAGGVTTSITFTVSVDVPGVQHYGSWVSALALYNAVLGISYDLIGGLRCITIGIGGTPSIDTNGYVPPDITELGRPITAFQHWVEVYRIPLTQGAATYFSTRDYLLQSGSWGPNGNQVPFILGLSFGVGDSQGSICTVADDGTGNLSITLNPLYSSYTDVDEIYTAQVELNYCFNYYDEITNRYTQLESQLPNGQTHCFAGFNSAGAVQTTLVYPNIYSSVNDSGGTA